VHGVDIVGSNIALFQDLYNKFGIKNCTSEVMNIDESKVEEKKFDRAISFEVLEHVQDENTTLENIYSSLNKNGLFAISIPNKWWIFETHGANLPLLPWNRIPFFSWMPKCIHRRYAKARIYTKKQIINLLEANGFSVEKAYYITAPMDVIKWYPLRCLLRRTIFRANTTKIPFLSTSIMIIARKK
jgi:2-polyprenyl-3-methyl-5-hydroxy-6-metoxy-1,4-benzoquinol methylase